MAKARRFSRMGLLGNLIVLAILIGGARLWWTNVNRGAGPPPASSALIVEAAERVGYDSSSGARRLPSDPPSRPLDIAPSGLAIPVLGVRPTELVDTYTQSRAGGARVHNAIDIMAEVGRPVISASDGTVEKLYYSRGGGGVTAYVRSPDGQFLHYYAHLDAYAPSLKEGMRIRRGDPIGTVGFTGNASPSGPHLHYAINRMAPGERWWEGSPVNPYPLLAGTGERR